MGEGKAKAYLAAARTYIAPVIFGALILLCASFATKQHGNRVCSGLNISIQDDDQYRFINEHDIRKAFDKTARPEGKSISSIDLSAIEARIRRNPFVKNVQVYFDMHGELHADVSQRVPVIRVINPALQEYYLDNEGKRMPLSTEYSAYVPVATASYFNLTEKRDSVLHSLDSSLNILAQYLDSNKFAHALTGQVIINPGNELTIVPRLGNFQIELGTVENLDDKFLRLQSFYRTTLPQVGWTKYSRISLKYKNQIVANN
jgi:cell division protein FtsQ